ncbi:hypothetical protein GGR92_003614 [Spirosoma lacussanchae]|uniref:hypothetical protein n=1 Tax=Spirosoma lacussanchae TaxID=1884249 RepID=UPI001108803D|nr:hypothetical protein [Spirosoma lacussanchae]
MKQTLLATLFFLVFPLLLSAQDAIYTANGNRISDAQLTGITEDKVSFTVQRDGKASTFNFQRANVLFAFSRTGNFLVINDLSSDLTKAQQQLSEYLSAPVRAGGREYLIRAVPLTVIPATIAYESDAIVNYKTTEGKSASIPKSELVGILYQDGRHQLLREAAEIAPLLKDIGGQIKGETLAAKPQAPTASSPESLPTPSPTAPTALPTDGAAKPEAVIPQAKVADKPLTSESATDVRKPALTEGEYQGYRKKALQKVDEFVSYLNIITDKKLPTYEKDKAIDQAARLFMPAATIAVTSISKPGARRYPIRDYLNRLKLLPYSSAQIEWSEVQYIKELSQAADGNYYGVITGQQTFIGYGSQDQVLYSDVVQKNVRVKLQSYGSTSDGVKSVKWDVLLGSIGVAQ